MVSAVGRARFEWEAWLLMEMCSMSGKGRSVFVSSYCRLIASLYEIASSPPFKNLSLCWGVPGARSALKERIEVRRRKLSVMQARSEAWDEGSV